MMNTSPFSALATSSIRPCTAKFIPVRSRMIPTRPNRKIFGIVCDCAAEHVVLMEGGIELSESGMRASSFSRVL